MKFNKGKPLPFSRTKQRKLQVRLLQRLQLIMNNVKAKFIKERTANTVPELCPDSYNKA